MTEKKYKPGYEDPENYPDSHVVSGSARTNIMVEEAAQRGVAESDIWLLARKMNSGGRGDSRVALEALGFTVNDMADELFYQVQPPAGWKKSTNGYWTTVLDDKGEERISQFFKGAWYDRDAFLSIKQGAENV